MKNTAVIANMKTHSGMKDSNIRTVNTSADIPRDLSVTGSAI